MSSKISRLTSQPPEWWWTSAGAAVLAFVWAADLAIRQDRTWSALSSAVLGCLMAGIGVVRYRQSRRPSRVGDVGHRNG